jgi:hypothetical protein
MASGAKREKRALEYPLFPRVASHWQNRFDLVKLRIYRNLSGRSFAYKGEPAGTYV